MTFKEIIIGGIDVSECDHLKYDYIGCDIDQTYCLGNNCYFKQLKRAERKLEKIKVNCNETLSECSCKNPIIDIDCRECTSGGRINKAKEILQIIEDEENGD